MKVVILLYHDVIDPQRSRDSGFTNADAQIYKLSPDDFWRHLEAIVSTAPTPDGIVREYRKRRRGIARGRASKMAARAQLQSRMRWTHVGGRVIPLFPPTTVALARGFVDKAAIRDLHRRRHVLGSHSCLHPLRTHLDDAQLTREWSERIEVRQYILGKKMGTASVPGGFYSPRVVKHAWCAGIRVAFNSDPTCRVLRWPDFLIFGRFGLPPDSSPEAARRFVVHNRATFDRGRILERQKVIESSRWKPMAGFSQIVPVALTATT